MKVTYIQSAGAPGLPFEAKDNKNGTVDLLQGKEVVIASVPLGKPADREDGYAIQAKASKASPGSPAPEPQEPEASGGEEEPK